MEERKVEDERRWEEVKDREPWKVPLYYRPDAQPNTEGSGISTEEGKNYIDRNGLNAEM